MHRYFVSIIVLTISSFGTWAQVEQNNYEFIPITFSNNLEHSLEKLHRLVDAKTGANLNDSIFTIVHFGDSHIQGDKFCNGIRTVLYENFGFAGNGIIFPYSLCKSFGPNGVEAFSTGNWKYSSFISPSVSTKVGLSGFELTTYDSISTLRFKLNEKFKGVTTNRIKIWYSQKTAATSFYLDSNFIEVGHSENINFASKSFKTKTPLSDLTIHIRQSPEQNESFSFYGFEFESENKTGINYHRSGVVAAQFTDFISNSSLILEQLIQIKPEIIIFSFGTNESYSKVYDSIKYLNLINEILKEIAIFLPETAIILTNAPDTRSQGKTPPNQVSVNNQLMNAAISQRVSFFDLNKAMGGWGSLNKWYDAKLTRDDKLHFNSEGYELQGKMFSLALLESYNRKFKDTPIDINKLKLDISKIIIPLLTKKKLEIKTKQSTTTTERIDINSNFQQYIVKPGDNLSKIARLYKISIEQLVKTNKIEINSIIKVGQILLIP